MCRHVVFFRVNLLLIALLTLLFAATIHTRTCISCKCILCMCLHAQDQFQSHMSPVQEQNNNLRLFDHNSPVQCHLQQELVILGLRLVCLLHEVHGMTHAMTKKHRRTKCMYMCSNNTYIIGFFQTMWNREQTRENNGNKCRPLFVR